MLLDWSTKNIPHRLALSRDLILMNILRGTIIIHTLHKVYNKKGLIGTPLLSKQTLADVSKNRKQRENVLLTSSFYLKYAIV